MNETHKSLLDLLKRVAAFMDENGITFYLFGGTAIGALRHRGFIPWDDDIDLLVDRDNYYKLMAAADQLPDDLEFQCFELNHDFAKPYGMFSRKTDTATSRSRMYWGGVCMGTAIDVFLTDDVPEDKVAEYTKDLFLYQDVMVDAWVYKNEVSRYKKEYFDLKKRQQEIGKPALMAELKAKLEQYSYEESSRRIVRCSGRSPVRAYRKEWIGEPVYCEFEGLRMPLQTMPEACLRMQYGYDWYLIPEPDKRDHHVQITNYDISYNNYYEDISRFIDWDEAAETIRTRKIADIDRLDLWLDIDNVNAELMARAILLRADIAGKRDEIRDRYDKREYSEAAELLSDITDNVKLFIKSGCGKGKSPSADGSQDRQEGMTTQGEIPQDILKIWIECLMRSGRYYDARKVRIAFVDDDAAGEELRETLDILDKVLLMAEHYQDHKAEACAAVLRGIPQEYQHIIPDCITAKSWLAGQGAADAADSLSITDICREYLKDFPDNYDVIKVLGDQLIASGDREQGETLYRQVLENSRNGLDLLEIGDYFAEAEAGGASYLAEKE